VRATVTSSACTVVWDALCMSRKVHPKVEFPITLSGQKQTLRMTLLKTGSSNWMGSIKAPLLVGSPPPRTTPRAINGYDRRESYLSTTNPQGTPSVCPPPSCGTKHTHSLVPAQRALTITVTNVRSPLQCPSHTPLQALRMSRQPSYTP